MKKIKSVAILLIAMLCSVALAACGSKNGNNNNEQSDNIPLPTIVGKWQIDEIEIIQDTLSWGVGLRNEWIRDGVYYQIKSNNMLYLYDKDGDGDGPWVLGVRNESTGKIETTAPPQRGRITLNWNGGDTLTAMQELNLAIFFITMSRA